MQMMLVEILLNDRLLQFRWYKSEEFLLLLHMCVAEADHIYIR
jgi:hypothetical protein